MAVDYDVRAEVVDAGGNVGTGSSALTIDVLTEPLYGKRRILVDNVLFEGYTTRFLYWNSDVEAQNVVTLEKMGDILRKFPDYRIELDGHAVSLLYYDSELSDREHEAVLLPLSLARTEIIRDLFLGYGADADRFTLNGWGKLRPLVPFDDLDGRAMNRRVEFYLVR
jgi:outer membrane protein OmpA-like peptidoglycan-associated protein